MNFRLIDSRWDELFDQTLRSKKRIDRLRIICPFIKQRAAGRFLKRASYKQIQIITRFNQDDFRAGVSDTRALRELLGLGAQIRGIQNLHAKVYLIGDRAIVTSANLTEQALARNHEFGFCSDDPTIVEKCHQYFESLWCRAGEDLEVSRIDGWDERISQSKASGSGKDAAPSLGDDGTDLGFSPESSTEPNPANTSEQGFVKFFAVANERVDPDKTVLKDLNDSTAHWALSYPATKRPRSVKDGALMFISVLTKPNDIRIFGRGVAIAYRPGVDEATKGDIRKRKWKKRWSRYIRVEHVEFINGSVADGVSLNELMRELREFAFATTKARYLQGERNINLPRSYARRAHVELTPESIAWLNDQLDRRFERFGKVSDDALNDLIHPEP